MEKWLMVHGSWLLAKDKRKDKREKEKKRKREIP